MATVKYGKWRGPGRSGGAERRAPGRMNKTEARYAARLALLKAGGAVQWCAFEPVKLRLADRTFYTPDFMVVAEDGTIEFHEVKGHWRDDARVKIKVAAEQFPMFRFVAAREDWRGGTVHWDWEIEEF